MLFIVLQCVELNVRKLRDELIALALTFILKNLKV